LSAKGFFPEVSNFSRRLFARFCAICAHSIRFNREQAAELAVARAKLRQREVEIKHHNQLVPRGKLSYGLTFWI